MYVCVHNNIILEKKTFILLKWGLKIFSPTNKDRDKQSKRECASAREVKHWNYPKIVVAAAAVVRRHEIVQCCVCNAHTHKFSIEKQECDGLKYPYEYIDARTLYLFLCRKVHRQLAIAAAASNEVVN